MGHWIETTASPAERRNFFEFMHMIGHFERKLGLQQRRDPARMAAQRRAAQAAAMRASGRRTRVVDGIYNDEESKDDHAPGSQTNGDMLVVQLGSNLKCGIRFFV